MTISGDVGAELQEHVWRKYADTTRHLEHIFAHGEDSIICSVLSQTVLTVKYPVLVRRSHLLVGMKFNMLFSHANYQVQSRSNHSNTFPTAIDHEQHDMTLLKGAIRQDPRYSIVLRAMLSPHSLALGL